MDETTCARLRDLLDAVDTAAEGDSNDAEISAGFELAEYVREMVDAVPEVSTLVTSEVTVSAMREWALDGSIAVVFRVDANTAEEAQQIIMETIDCLPLGSFDRVRITEATVNDPPTVFE